MGSRWYPGSRTQLKTIVWCAVRSIVLYDLPAVKHAQVTVDVQTYSPRESSRPREFPSRWGITRNGFRVARIVWWLEISTLYA